MPAPDSPIGSVPRLSTAPVLPAALLTVVVLWLAWLLRAGRAENAALRGEVATMLLAQRAAASRESLAADALRRAARLEEALTLMRREPPPATPATSPDAGRAAELERVIVFLREEISAAHETIERLKHDEVPRQPEKR